MFWSDLNKAVCGICFSIRRPCQPQAHSGSLLLTIGQAFARLQGAGEAIPPPGYRLGMWRLGSDIKGAQ